MILKKNLIKLFCFISLFNIIQNACVDVTPNIKYDCFKYSTPEQFCCYDSANTKCSLIAKTDIKKNEALDCGVSEDNYGLYEFEEYHPRNNLDLPFLSCGEKNPEKKGDCLEYSELTNSCCYFKNSKGQSGCFYIGKRYSGDLEEKKFTYNSEEIIYECKSCYGIFNLYLIFFFIILFF